MQWFETFRYDYPKLFHTLVVIAGLFLCYFVFMALPDTAFMRAIGVVGAQKRVTALQYATYWKVRASTGSPSDGAAPAVAYGNLAGLDRNGGLIVSVPSGASYVQRTVKLADIQITDLYGTAALIGQLRLEDARFDVYADNQVVVWIRGVPFNVKLIEAGYARPDPNPPTNIVDMAFATYYWAQFNGRSVEPVVQN